MVLTFDKIAANKALEKQSILQQSYNSKQKAKFNINENRQFSLDNQNNFSVTVDRLFICVRDGKQTISILEELGLTSFQSVIRSTSQGTLSKIFFFNNLYLEIVWLEKPSDLNREELTALINFKARVNWRQTKVSPFGMGIVNCDTENSFTIDSDICNDLVIDRFLYYFQQNQKNSLEPFIFLLPEYLSIQNNLKQIIKANTINHPLGVREVTNIKIRLQKGRRRTSNILNHLQRSNILRTEYMETPLLELTFDYGVQQRIIDARPILPLIIKL